MVKSKSSYKETFLYCNLLILMGLIGACYYLHTDIDELGNDSVYEGVTNMGCCGGIQGGVHYNETDTKPPPYVRRCFKSFNDNGKTSYTWSGFPCTSSENSDCCDNKGECIATTKGGYCDSSEGKFIFNRRKSESSMYIKRSNDDIIDINDTNDMKDFYFKEGESAKTRHMSSEMKRFMNRRDENERYMQKQLVNKNAERAKDILDVTDKLQDRRKHTQIVYSLTLIHLIILIGWSIVTKDFIIQKIAGFYGFLGLQVDTFQGKNIQGNANVVKVT
tara:strand:+ start:267 stop:1094 length:828 start_codon:yes stop_codon:yes gene_type:complete